MSAAVAVAATDSPALANDYYNSLHEARASNDSWMGELPGDRSLAGMSVPGTHDSLALCGFYTEGTGCEAISTGITKTQQDFGFGSKTLSKQLQYGIRSLDIRVRVNKEGDKRSFTIHHGVYYQHANFTDVLTTLRDFLAAHSRETVLLHLKAECENAAPKDCYDAPGNDNDEARRAVFREYLDGTADGTKWSDLFWDKSITGTSQADVPLLSAVRGKVVLLGFRGPQGGIYPGYGLSQVYPAGGRNEEFVQDDYELATNDDIARKWEKVRAHLRRANGTFDLSRGGEKEYGFHKDKMYINYLSGSGGVRPWVAAGGEVGWTGVNAFLIQCLKNSDTDDGKRCPEFFPGRDSTTFEGTETLTRMGAVMLDFPSGEIVNRIVDANVKGADPTPTTPPTPANPYPSDARTIQVNAGGTSFAATQPRNSVATYTWTDGGAPQEWLTSANPAGTALNRKTENMTVAAYGGTTDTITVNPVPTGQVIEGFGGAMTDSAAALIGTDRTALDTLFGTGEGQAGLTMARSPMGSSDLMADPNDFHTYEDTRGSFSVTAQPSGVRQINSLVAAKQAAGGNLKIIGTPWSAPGWAKRGGSLRPSECGTQANQLDSKQIPAYAEYFKKYVAAYTDRGIKPWMVSMQNEPQNCKTQMPTTLMTAGDQVALSKALRAQLPQDVQIMGWDHNWNDPDYVDALATGGSVDAIGYHCYVGNHYGAQTSKKPTYMTECSGWTDRPDKAAEDLGWTVANHLMGPLLNGSKGATYWSLAQNADGSPFLGGGDSCKTCRGLLSYTGGGTFAPSQEFYYYAQFARFVRPGFQRTDSSSSGDVSTVAFKSGTKNVLVVLVSGTRVDGGAAADGELEYDLRNQILHFKGETAAQKTSWLVGADGYRRWVPDIATYDCLKAAGKSGPVEAPGSTLDKYINLKDVWAVCGAYTMGTNSELEVGTYLKSGGGARLTLTNDGLRTVDTLNKARWAPSGAGDRLILQEDNNLVLYKGSQVLWASNTMGSGAVWLSVRDDGTFALFDKSNQKVWMSTIGTRDYRRALVTYDGDTAAQKTSWLVGNDGKRRWVPDLATFQCLHDTGSGNSVALSSDVLSTLPDLSNVWAACGTDRIGAGSSVEENAYLKAGDYRLTVTSGALTLTKSGTKVWSPGKGGAQLTLQTDGNLVMIDKNGAPTWATGTFGKSAGWLVLGTDGSLRLYDAAGKQVWTR
ncbi:phosphatidylinositol-specific phospholipase C domain-containing protein [Actinoplanes awajinensis]|uniref:1-phosphatidylinositol phosphodiesterase n=1 Tax=Actinoplanes awajinensis subsp. mycoplanecinus TaxID=135947 RepID=A0A117MMD1_9ACTN|nr:phosphatidylinositol-specific phospholipase C domain-containing protein [Actinoplanes awajinensis]KUL25314.1 hypothetical protein ADL15_41070 [Actinoplanes awajinensis subsp. mycoplanecinus]